MADSTRLSGKIFAEGALAIHAFQNKIDFDETRLKRVAASIALLVQHGEDLRGRWPKVMRYVDAAISLMQKHNGEWGQRTLPQKLEEVRQTIEDICAKVIKVDDPRLEDTLRFCQDMQFQLRLMERGHLPHKH